MKPSDIDIIEAAAVVTGERGITRKLARAIVAVNPGLAKDVDAMLADRSMKAARLVLGHGAPPPVTAADRVWVWLDATYGPEITRAALERARCKGA